jgi:hypothetical protein
MQLCFEVGDVPIQVQGHGARAEAIARRLLGSGGWEEKGAEGLPGEVTLSLHVAGALPLPPPGAEPVARQEEAGVTVDRAGTVYHLRGAEMTVDVDPAAGWATAVIREDEGGSLLSREGGMLLLSGLGVLLRPRGLYPLRAAALAQEGVSVLLAAPGGTGKSAPSAGPEREGWRFLGDDTVLLRPSDEAVEAIPFRRATGPLPDALKRLAGLSGPGRGPRAGGPSAQDVGALTPAVRAAQTARACVPRLLVFPEIVGFRRSRLEPIRRSEALLRLANQSGLLSLSALWTRDHLDVLRRLAAQTVPYRLVAGRDLLAEPGRGAEMLRAVMSPAPATI